MSVSTAIARAARPATFADLIDKGVVIHAFVRLSIVGIELLTMNASIVIASVDSYLQFADAANRLDLSRRQATALPELVRVDRDALRAGKGDHALGSHEGAKKVASEIVGTVRRDEEEDPPRRG